jgi:hypothetical protein
MKFYETDGTNQGGELPDLSAISDPEKLDELLANTYKEPEAPEQDKVSDNSDEGQQEDQKTAGDEVKSENKEEIKPEEKQEETPKEDKVSEVILTDELLTKIGEKLGATEEERAKALKKLDSFKGKNLDELVKALAHSQMQIDKLSTEKGKEHKQQLFKPVQKEQLAPDTPEYRNKLILNRVRDLLPEGVELPPNLDMKSPDFKEWMNDFAYNHFNDALDFKSALTEEIKAVDTVMARAREVEENYSAILDNQQKEAVQQIDGFFKQFSIDLKEFGHDLTPDAQGDISAINKILFDENGNIDDNLVEYIFGRTPVLKPEAIAAKFTQQYLPELIKQKHAKDLENARREAMKLKAEKKEVPPSLGKSPAQKKENSYEDLGQITDPDALDKLLRDSYKS